uniref:Uncharacterized protein n=1 Tax=Anguilla anguilla TaxID=7936 RepID=A0A0E9SEM8_ANGAN
MLFTKKRKLGDERLTLYGQSMEKVSEFKYLGLWLDNKYTWQINSH